MAAVAARLGVAPGTLRTWDRRYGLGPSEHTAGAHRRYNADDVERLEVMRRLTREGVAPAEAARVALDQPFTSDVPRPPGETTPVAPSPDPAMNGSGGRVLSLPGADAAVRGLGRAAMALDARTVTATVRRLIDEHGVLHTWDHVLRPVLVAVGARWAATGEGIEVEHMLSDCTAVVLRDVASRAAPNALPESGAEPGRRSVLLACAPGEWHALPLNALAAGLGERGISSRTLGPATPGTALRAAVTRIGPAALFLWSQTTVSAEPQVLADVPVRRPPTAVVVGGPGWAPDRLPPGVTVAVDLPHAVELIGRAVGA